MVNAPTTAYTEVQIDENSVSLTLITESQDGPHIEETARFTFDELQSLSGQHFTLSLSGDSREAFEEQSRLSAIGQILDSQESVEDEPTYPDVGEVVYDTNAPDWSDDERVEVTEVLSSVATLEYVIQGLNEGHVMHPAEQHWTDKTVADANPRYDADDAVILGKYTENGDVYAFPAGRLDTCI